MIDVTLTIGKEQVYEEVAQTTSYAGAKMADEHAYDRIFTTDEDNSMLERFWNESKNTLVDVLKEYLLAESEEDGVYTIHLEMPDSYINTLTDSVQRNIFSFFVMSIVSKWFVFTNKEDVATYLSQSTASLNNIRKAVYMRGRPERPTY